MNSKEYPYLIQLAKDNLNLTVEEADKYADIFGRKFMEQPLTEEENKFALDIFNRNRICMLQQIKERYKDKIIVKR